MGTTIPASHTEVMPYVAMKATISSFRSTLSLARIMSLSKLNAPLVSRIPFPLASSRTNVNSKSLRSLPCSLVKFNRVYVRVMSSLRAPRVVARSVSRGPRLSVVRTGIPRSRSKVKPVTEELNEGSPIAEVSWVLS